MEELYSLFFRELTNEEFTVALCYYVAVESLNDYFLHILSMDHAATALIKPYFRTDRSVAIAVL